MNATPILSLTKKSVIRKGATMAPLGLAMDANFYLNPWVIDCIRKNQDRYIHEDEDEDEYDMFPFPHSK